MTAVPPGFPMKYVGWRLPCHPRSVSRARRLLREQVRTWHVPEEAAETAVLLFSELTSNACKHAHASPGREIHTLCVVEDGRLRIEVADAGEGLPQLRQATEDDEGGRGLALVDALADAWSALPRPHGIGKTVWCELKY